MTPDDVDFAVKMLDGHFDPRTPKRLISGVAISKTFRDAQGATYHAQGCSPMQMPLPLLLSHNPLQPVGLVRSLDVVCDQLHFTAEIASTDRQPWVQQSWPRIAAGEWTHVSIQGKSIGPAFDRNYDRWALYEISIAGDDALDFNAGIRKVWSESRVVRLDSRPSAEIHWRAVRVAR